MNTTDVWRRLNSGALPRKFLMTHKDDGSYVIMCEIEDRTFTAQVPAGTGEKFLSLIFDEFMKLVVQSGVVKPTIRRR